MKHEIKVNISEVIAQSWKKFYVATHSSRGTAADASKISSKIRLDLNKEKLGSTLK